MDKERIELQKSVTDTLMRAMEHADNMKQVIVLYETHEDCKTSTGGVFTQEDVTLSKINWLLDLGKHWLFDD